MTRLQHLIEESSRRILKSQEQAEMVRLFWERKGGTLADLRQKVNRAYAIAKRYDAVGGGTLLEELDFLFDELGNSDFKVLYAACK